MEQTIRSLTQKMKEMVDEKGWSAPETKRPQSARNMACSLCIEAAEVLEYFQWDETIKDPEGLALELADVQLYLLQLAAVSGIDLEKAVLDKLRINHTRHWDE